MDLLRITEQTEKADYLEYIREKLQTEILNPEQIELTLEGRAVLSISFSEENAPIVISEIYDKLSEVICVAYKYEVFEKRIRAYGLNDEERGLLLASVIAADYDDDKRYVKSRLRFNSECAIDGLYNFRLGPLSRKWEEISAYIPEFFTPDELKEFIVFLIDEKKGRKVYIDGEKLYDSKKRQINRSKLLPYGKTNNIVKETLLAGAGEVYILGQPPENDEKVLRKYFGNKICRLSR